MTNGASSSGPPVFCSFREFYGALIGPLPSSDPSPSLPQATQAAPTIQSAFPSLAPRITQAGGHGFERYNPSPFMPDGFQRVPVANQQPSVRAVLMRPRPVNKDVVIITIHPMLPHEVQFQVIYDVVREFLVEHKHVELKEIQSCHLGQAFVRFEFVHDRDRLVHLSPHHHSGLQFSLVKHNQGRN